MLLNDCITDHLRQRGLMLTLGDVVDFNGDEITARPKTDHQILKTSSCLPVWFLMELMGQTAELMWRLKGMDGVCYLAKISNFTGLAHTIEQFEIANIVTKAFPAGSVEKTVKSHSELFCKSKSILSLDVVHVFSSRGDVSQKPESLPVRIYAGFTAFQGSYGLCTLTGRCVF